MRYVLVILISIFFMACEQNSPSEKMPLSNNLLSTPRAVISTIDNKPASGNVFEYGIYTAQRKGRIRDSMNTNTGKIVSKPVLTLYKTTKKIPLIKNTYFAYRYRLLDLPKDEVKKPTIELRKVLIHPQMTLPDGTQSSGWDRVIRGRTSVGQVIAFDGYVFNEDYELVAGDWVFQIWYKDQKLVEHVFTTYNVKSTNRDLVISTHAVKSDS